MPGMFSLHLLGSCDLHKWIFITILVSLSSPATETSSIQYNSQLWKGTASERVDKCTEVRSRTGVCAGVGGRVSSFEFHETAPFDCLRELTQNHVQHKTSM